MVNVRVRTILGLREIIGAREIRLALDEGATTKDLLRLLFEKYGSRLRRRIVDSGGTIHPYITILINGREISFLGGMETRLTEGDVISILPPVGGG